MVTTRSSSRYRTLGDVMNVALCVTLLEGSLLGQQRQGSQTGCAAFPRMNEDGNAGT